jgi:hypothetical protein
VDAAAAQSALEAITRLPPDSIARFALLAAAGAAALGVIFGAADLLSLILIARPNQRAADRTNEAVDCRLQRPTDAVLGNDDGRQHGPVDLGQTKSSGQRIGRAWSKSSCARRASGGRAKGGPIPSWRGQVPARFYRALRQSQDSGR